MRFAGRFGIFVIIVSLFSGCGSMRPERDPYYMTIEELGRFVPNCKFRDQQIQLLMSQYTTDRDELAFSWRGMSGEARRANDIIRYNLIYLRSYC